MTASIMNTKKKGRVTVFTFRRGKKFISVCLELDIVKEGINPEVLGRDMREAVEGHIEAVLRGKLSDDLLNRPAPAAYWKEYWAFVEGLRARPKRGVRIKAHAGTVNVLTIADLAAV